MKLTWLGRACFLLTTDDALRILFDPYLELYRECASADFPLPDMICVSHGHLDHFADVPELVRGESPALVVAVPPLCRALRELVPETQHRLYPLPWDDDVDIESVHFFAFKSPPMETSLYSMFAEFGAARVLEFLQAARQLADDILYLPLTSFGVEVGGKRILHFISEDEAPQNGVDVAQIGVRFHPDVVLLSVQHGDEVKSAQYAADLGAPLVIPHHYRPYQAVPGADMALFESALARLAPACTLKRVEALQPFTI